ncbi:MAG: carboxylesterase family protein [Deltaproteobacteria bacterium]|nr:carboxylesterase family protein [Deltaproteobacteria bacterium]
MKPPTKPAQGLFGKGIKFGPIVDGWAVPDDPGLIFLESRMADVPFMLGSNADEGTIFFKQVSVKSVEAYNRVLKIFGRDHAPELMKFFPVKTEAEIKPTLNKLVGVSIFVSAARSMARAAVKKNPKVYLYHFTRVPPIERLKPLGAFHAAEIFYVFGNLGPIIERNDTDRSLSEKMTAYWTNFAKTGDPNGEGLPLWPAYETDKDQHLELGAEIKTGQGLYKEECDVFEKLLIRRIKESHPERRLR